MIWEAALPSGLVHVSITVNRNAPANSAAVVIVSDRGSFVCTVQVPSPLSAPSLRLDPGGTPATVTVTAPTWSTDGSTSPRLIGDPATPAGRTCPPLISVVRFV